VSSSGDGDEEAGASDAGDAADAGETGDGREAVDTDGTDDGPEWWEDPEPDPPSLGPEIPSVDIPEVEVPGTDSDPDSVEAGVDVDAETAKGFWRLVLVVDVALLALALGPMFIYFQGDWRRGGMFIGLGALASLYGIARVREFRAAGEETTDDETESVEEA
jgi:hypothetical protein